MVWYFGTSLHRFSHRWHRNFIRCNFLVIDQFITQGPFRSLQICILVTQHLSTLCWVTIMKATDLKFVFLDSASFYFEKSLPFGSSGRQNEFIQTWIRKSAKCMSEVPLAWHHRVIDIKFAWQGCLLLTDMIWGHATAFLDKSVCGSLEMLVSLHVFFTQIKPVELSINIDNAVTKLVNNYKEERNWNEISKRWLNYKVFTSSFLANFSR